jgi:malate synthase
MADFEDSCSPTWDNIIEGHLNLYDAVRGTISFLNPVTSKLYQLNESTATLMVRPRGLHLNEKNILIAGQEISAALFDFGLFMFHNAHYLISKGSGPYFYLPKLEDHEEAVMWNNVFLKAQKLLDIPKGTIKATVLLETLPAAFQMNEILFALREHSAGLNCGRWDYIFSYIKNMHASLDEPLPDRSQITMEDHFMKSYCELLVQTCHKRGAFAMGGMAAQIPIKNDPKANERAINKVKQDKIREVLAGHDGTWVAHPGLIQIARECFKAHMKTPNQIDFDEHPYKRITKEDLLRPPEGSITEEGVILNIDVGVRYIVAWLKGNGCVPIYNLMEDMATAEISRTQLWHWFHKIALLEDGRTLDYQVYKECAKKAKALILHDVTEKIFEADHYEVAFTIMEDLVTKSELTNFLPKDLYNNLDL